jgi:hypothetical protein
MWRPPFTPRKIPGTHFCYRLRRPQGHSAAGRIRSTEKSNNLIAIRTRDLPACSIVPQPTTLPRAPTPLGTHRIERWVGPRSSDKNSHKGSMLFAQTMVTLLADAR